MTPEHQRLVASLADHGHLPAGWRPAFEAIHRAAFVPDDIWAAVDGRFRSVRRADDERTWLDLVYSDVPLTTQVNDGHPIGPDTELYPSSSTSQPSIMAMMLDASQLQPGQRVLEIGTGTGYNAALLSARLGETRVTTVELDLQVAAQAINNLLSVDLKPTVCGADGADGWPHRAPYDAVIATATAERVPYQWVRQTKLGGRIIVPYGNRWHNGALLRLAKTGPSSAYGNFAGDVAFMWLRDQRPHLGWLAANAPEELPEPDEVTNIHPYWILHDFDGSFAVGIHIPDVSVTTYDHPDGDPHHYEAWLYDPASKSMASVEAPGGAAAEFTVRQHGPRRLWDEAVAAHRWWNRRGRPAHTRFGMTIAPDMEQWIWLDEPGQRLSAG